MSCSKNNVYCSNCKFRKYFGCGHIVCKFYYYIDYNFDKKLKRYHKCEDINKNNNCSIYQPSFIRKLYLLFHKGEI
jgi:hypothetical protein